MKINILAKDPYVVYCHEFITRYDPKYVDGCRVDEPGEYTEIKNLVNKYCAKDKAYLDVGAHCGFSLFPIIRSGYKTIAVEPLQNNIEYLHKGLVENKMTSDVYKFALTEKNGEVDMFFTDHYDNAALSSEGAVLNVRKDKVISERVESKTLDFFSGRGVGFVKMDTQGAEVGILRGGKKLIEESPVFFIEWHEGLSKLQGYDLEETKEILKDYNFYPLGGNALFIPKHLGDI